MDRQSASWSPEEFKENIKSQIWRLNNLYWCVDDYGNAFNFKLNWAQSDLLDNLHTLNIILKARQLGFTTFVDLLLLDNCLFTPNTRAGIIAHTLEDAKVIFRDKVWFPFSRLPEHLQACLKPKTESSRELHFANNSSIRVGTSMRSGTLQYVHVSEYGKLCAKFPEKAREVRTGALNTIREGCIAFIESTAEGRGGHFYQLCDGATKREELGEALTSLDFKRHFYPWFKHPHYQLSNADTLKTPITKEFRDYFANLKQEHGIELTPQQRAWYVKKSAQQGEDMGREFPSTQEEAFAASVEGAYYKKEMLVMRREKRICRVPYEPSVPVNTFWDLGYNDDMVILFHQRVGPENRFFDCIFHSGEGLQYYTKALKDKEYSYGKHYLPHDAEVHNLDRVAKTRSEILYDLGLKPQMIVPRIDTEMDGISGTRGTLRSCYIDKENCDELIACLDNYRAEYDEKLEVFKSTPLHNWASHGAKAFECFALGFRPGYTKDAKKKRRPSWRTV